MAAWSANITSDPAILGGKPVVRGTRLAVDFVLSLFASGWTQEQVLENYPSLTAEASKAVFAYAADVLHEEVTRPPALLRREAVPAQRECRGRQRAKTSRRAPRVVDQSEVLIIERPSDAKSAGRAGRQRSRSIRRDET